MADTIIMYGTTWCPDCTRAKRVLERHDVPYTWINIEEDPEARRLVSQINGGFMSVPTILFPDGSILVEPGNRELEAQLGV
jgi:mycoredoxin